MRPRATRGSHRAPGTGAGHRGGLPRGAPLEDGSAIAPAHEEPGIEVAPGDTPEDLLERALAPYDFSLPDERIARHPLPERDGSRLLVVGPPHADRTVLDLPSLLGPGDLLVVNDIRVHHARLRAQRESGGNVEVFLAGGDEALVRPSRRLREGERLACGPGHVLLRTRLADGRWRIACEPDVDTLTSAAGELPLPPYFDRAPTPEDEERYQTVYSRVRGDLRGAAAPTAGLHLTPRIFEALAARGVQRASLTLEVGLGTFRPLGAEQIARGALHPERFDIPAETWAAVRAAKRVVAVGTTVARALESATGPGAGTTDLFIREGYTFGRVGALLTNFHLPRSSLLMLVGTFGGRERVLDAYRHAVAAEYRFYSYGDAMLLTR